VVNLSYPVTVGHGMLDRLPDVLEQVSPGNRVAVISDRQVALRYGKRVTKLLKGSQLFTIPGGEKHKNRKTWATITDKLLDAGFGRDTTIIALGGGVVGDLAGFVAATYMRGIPVIQAPTSLLAMVDASIGGKTGVDTRAGKNLVGAFHQPAAVVADLDVLATLPREHLSAGFAEVIKHGVISDADYFEQARAYASRWPKPRAALDGMLSFVTGSIGIKSSVVLRDEREGGLRQILNFGHTIAHAVESATKYRVLHGFAVAMGMVAEARIAELLGIAERGMAKTIADVCAMAGLPTELPKLNVAGLIKLTHGDKKARAGHAVYALPKHIGTMAGADSGWAMPVEDTIVREVLSKGHGSRF
jgi:3-dehydroquinate synthase